MPAEMSAEKARALALRSAAIFMQGRGTKEDVMRLAEEFFQYIVTGKLPEQRRW